MEFFMGILYMFILGSMLGYLLEVLFRRFFSAKRWINPGFLKGPYLPLYGTGLIVLYLLSSYMTFGISNKIANDILVCIFMGLMMTVIEYIAGIISTKIYKVKLWDYSNMRGNIQGIICPLFSFFWLAIAFGYFYLLHPYVIMQLMF